MSKKQINYFRKTSEEGDVRITLESDKDFYKHFPKIIYKYRDWGNVFHKRLITDNELFLSSAENFNDPFDCNFTFKLNTLKDDEAYKIYCRDLKILYPEWDETKIRLEAEILLKKSLHKNLDYAQYLSREYLRKTTFNNFGIVSLSMLNDNLLMWSHYSNSHTGICVGFDSKKLHDTIRGTIAYVNYQSNYPHFDPPSRIWDLSSEEINNYAFKLLTIKSEWWSYEKEIRIYKTNMTNKPITIPKSIFKYVIIGCNFPQNDLVEFIKMTKEKLPEVEIFLTKVHPEKFELQFYRLGEKNG